MLMLAFSCFMYVLLPESLPWHVDGSSSGSSMCRRRLFANSSVAMVVIHIAQTSRCFTYQIRLSPVMLMPGSLCCVLHWRVVLL